MDTETEKKCDKVHALDLLNELAGISFGLSQLYT